MAAAIKRSTLKLGMIPADGIGKEVIPVSSYSTLPTSGFVTFHNHAVSSSAQSSGDSMADLDRPPKE